MLLIKEIRERLLTNGASLVGFAQTNLLPDNIKKHFTTGISIAVALNPKTILGISNGPTMEYYIEYKAVNQKLDSLSSDIASFISINGYNTDFWGATDDRIYGHHLTELPHKTMATLSGLGWIGKCALLVTSQYGSAVRFTTVLTNIDIQIKDQAITKSRCGNCSICVEMCPGKAIKGINWHRGLYRDIFFNPDACRIAARKLALERTGIEYTFCGICIANCPYTVKYLNEWIS